MVLGREGGRGSPDGPADALQQLRLMISLLQMLLVVRKKPDSPLKIHLHNSGLLILLATYSQAR